MIEFNETQINEFHKALKTAREVMTPEQEKLLDAVLLIAWSTVEEENKLMSGFSGCFTPEQGSLLVDYTTGEANLRPQIFRGFIRLT